MAIKPYHENYIPEFLNIYELVYPEIYQQYEQRNELDKLWDLIHPMIRWTGDALRDLYGPIIVNTWYAKTSKGYHINYNGFTERGLRKKDTTTGAALSQHKLGNALDCHFPAIAAPDIVKSIEALNMHKSGEWRKNPILPIHHAFQFVTRIEKSIGGKRINWLHVDIKPNSSKNGEIVLLNL